MSSTEAAGPAASTPPDWSTLQIDLHCPRCGYNLRMLTGSRCPECGLDLDWDRIIASEERRIDSPLFEYRWRDRPIRSYFQTLSLCTRPWRLWQQISLFQSPRVGGLLLFFFATASLYCGAVFIEQVLSLFIRYWPRMTTGRPLLLAFVIQPLIRSLIFASTHVAIAASIFVVLQLFQQTFSKHHIRQSHILRLIVLAYPIIFPLKVIEDAIWILSWSGIIPLARHSDVILASVAFDGMALGYFLISLALGLSRYARILRSGQIALVVVGLTLLLWFSADLALFVSTGSWRNFFDECLEMAWPGLCSVISKFLGM